MPRVFLVRPVYEASHSWSFHRSTLSVHHIIPCVLLFALVRPTYSLDTIAKVRALLPESDEVEKLILDQQASPWTSQLLLLLLLLQSLLITSPRLDLAPRKGYGG